MSETTKPNDLTKEQLEAVSGGFEPVDGVVTDQELAHVVGGTGTTIGPTGAASVEPPKATVIGTGSDASNPGFTNDQFTNASSGKG
jgi:hypothetical protein